MQAFGPSFTQLYSAVVHLLGGVTGGFGVGVGGGASGNCPLNRLQDVVNDMSSIAMSPS